MVLSPDSEFFRYFGSNGELPAANQNLAPPQQPTITPELPSTDEPALDGLGIEETPAPSITLDDGSELQPTIGTEVPPPADIGAPSVPVTGGDAVPNAADAPPAQ